MLASRNKRGLALNLAKPSAQEVVRRLVAQADIFITNFPAVVRKKLGLRYEDLAPVNGRLIYASFTGYGESVRRRPSQALTSPHGGRDQA